MLLRLSHQKSASADDPDAFCERAHPKERGMNAIRMVIPVRAVSVDVH